MAHSVELIDPQCLLDRETLQDFIDLFFDARDSRFTIEVVPPSGKVPNPAIRGLCSVSNLGNFRITLYTPNIREQIARSVPMGGNFTRARDLKHGLYLVLTHELRHAHQNIYFGSNSTLHKGKYRARAGEVDARRHVDENYDAVCAFLGMEPDLLASSTDSMETSVYVDMLAESSAPDGTIKLSEDEIWDQVMTMSGDPETMYRRVMDGLRNRGLRLG